MMLLLILLVSKNNCMNFSRLKALIIKEAHELFRDKISLGIGIVMPIVLLLIFGYALSMDLNNIKLAIVSPQNSPINQQLINRFKASTYFKPTVYKSSEEGIKAVADSRADICLFIPTDLQKRLNFETLKFMIAGNGVNATMERLRESYVEITLLSGLSQILEIDQQNVVLNTRMLFNEANDSKYYLVPGVIVIIMTVIGALLTALVMAREYEHGNMESMFITPMQPIEILLAKAINNFVLGMFGLLFSICAAYFLFKIPIRGNIFILIFGSSLYMITMLGLGLLISSVTKNQFIACTLTLVSTFMPAFMLSGFIYEINNLPKIIQWVTFLVPARYYVEFMQTIFLAGNVWKLISIDLIVLAAFAIFYMIIAWKKNPKALEVK